MGRRGFKGAAADFQIILLKNSKLDNKILDNFSGKDFNFITSILREVLKIR